MSLWENTERRVRAQGISELSVNKHVADVQQMSYGALASYDVGYAKTDDANFELGSSLYRNLFASNQKIDDDTVLKTAAWMRSEAGRLKTMDAHDFAAGELHWTYPQGVVPTQEDLALEEFRGATGEWRSTLAVTGRRYWWNVNTRESRWERPKF